MFKDYPYPTIEEWIDNSLREDINRRGYAYWGDKPLGETWSIVYSYASDANHSELGESNFRTLENWLSESYPDDFESTSFGGAFGEILHIMIRMVNDDDSPSDIAKFVYEKLIDLSDYPVWDEEDLSERELKAQLESVRSEIAAYVKPGIDVHETAYDILWSLSNDDRLDFPENYVNALDSIGKGIELDLLSDDPNDYPNYLDKWLLNAIEPAIKAIRF